jgi:hypothetical protein
MSGIRVQQGSRLRFGEVVIVDGVEFWDVLDIPEIPEQRDDLVHEVQDFDRIDLLANTHYKDSRKWWVIAVANGMEELPTDLNSGDKIRIPSPRYVDQVLFAKASVQRR